MEELIPRTDKLCIHWTLQYTYVLNILYNNYELLIQKLSLCAYKVELSGFMFFFVI